MQKARLLLKDARVRPGAVLISIALVATFFISDSSGQSGRKLPNRSEPPASPKTSPAPVPPSEPPVEPKPERQRTKLRILRNLPSATASPIIMDILVDGCADHLKQYANVAVEVGREDVNRKQAIDLAKLSTDVYIVWLELDIDNYNMGRDPRQNGYRDAYSVSYSVFTPGTGKSKTSGRVFPRPYQPRVGNTPIPAPVPRTSGGTPLEYMLRQSGEEVAERVLDALKLVLPGRN